MNAQLIKRLAYSALQDTATFDGFIEDAVVNEGRDRIEVTNELSELKEQLGNELPCPGCPV